jgi:hypothetical protein
MPRLWPVLALALLPAGAIAADDSAVPPFMFINGGWLAGGADFRQPESGPGPVKDIPGWVRGGNQEGVQATFRMADVSNPILQPWAREALQKVNDRVAAGRPAYTPQVSCIEHGGPSFLLHPAQPVYFIQTKQEVLMIWPPNHEVRRIRLTDKHSPNLKPTWFGESIGHYENGDTLVVDTIGLNDKTFVDNYRTPHTTQLHVVERLRINPDGQGLTVDVLIEDPGAFTTPWRAVQVYTRQTPGPLLESSCAENPENFFGQDYDPVPRDDTPDF